MRIQLTGVGAAQGVETEAYGTDRVVGIGRAPNNGITIADGRVSGQHGELAAIGGKWTYRDLHSTNGSVVERGSERLVVDPGTAGQVLQDGDRLLLGDLDDPVCLKVALRPEPTGERVGEGTIVARRRMVADLSEVLLGTGGGLLALLRDVGGQFDAPAVFEDIADFLLGRMPGAAEVFLVLEPSGGANARQGEPAAWRLGRTGAEGAQEVEADPPPWPRTLVERCIDGNEACLAWLGEDPGAESLARLDVAGAIVAPLRQDDRAFGALVVLGTRLGPVDLELTSALALQVAGSVAGARLIRRLRAVERRLREENRALQQRVARDQTFTEIIGDSPAIRSVFEQMLLVKDTDATVLITGETGTGKELVARALHEKSRRARRHFAAINCAALTETLLESELFGHVKGAFTGATDHKKGLFQVADKGTLFLDELGELSLRLQAKLLRVLQEGEILPVGATRPLKVDVRILAATHRDLRTMARDGAFREDLFYRVNVFPIHLPPLRERGDDVAALALFFAQRYAERFGKKISGLSEGAARVLCQYAFPGNIRELENEMQRAVLLTAEGSTIDAAVFSDHVRETSTAVTPSGVGVAPGATLKETMDGLEREVLRRALEERGWNRSQTARELGISRQALMVKLSKYALVPE